jgi:hypothetical protein
MKNKMLSIGITGMFFLLTLFIPSAMSVTVTLTENTSSEDSEISSLDSGRGCAVFISLGLPGRITCEHVARQGETYFDKIGYDTKLISWPFVVSQVENDITNWIPANLGNKEQVFIYLAGHSDLEGNQIVGLMQFITDNNFVDWINTMERKCNPSAVTIVMETCYAGDIITKLRGHKRIIITSTDADNPSYFYPVFLWSYFSSPFFDALSNGKSYGEAWEYADNKVDSTLNPLIWDQNPQINDNYGTSGTAASDTLTPSNRLALRAYPDHIEPKSRTKQRGTQIRLIDVLERFLNQNSHIMPILKNILKTVQI